MTDLSRRLQLPNFSYMPHERTTISSVQRGFTFAPRYRMASKRADHTEFQNCARRFVAEHRIAEPFIFDNDGSDANDRVDGTGHVVENLHDTSSLGRRRREIYAALDRAKGPLDVVAYFGHGNPRSLSSAGIALPHLQTFAGHIAAKSSRNIVVVLYACLAGSPGGFAQQLATALLRRGVHATVFGHQTSGHTAWNANKRRYPGGAWVIPPSAPAWAEWQRSLRDLNGRFFARYPFMEPSEIVATLQGRPPGLTGRFE
jgi:hypothetical protein